MEQDLKKHRFSPHLPEAYYNGTDRDFLPHIMESLESLSLWNMLWLSQPALDGRLQGQRLILPTNFIDALYDDVENDHALCRKLTMHPSTFLEWFSREDPSVWDLYNASGGPLWVDTVTSRAKAAAKRIGHVSGTEGNVIHVNFRRRTA